MISLCYELPGVPVSSARLASETDREGLVTRSLAVKQVKTFMNVKTQPVMVTSEESTMNSLATARQRCFGW